MSVLILARSEDQVVRIETLPAILFDLVLGWPSLSRWKQRKFLAAVEPVLPKSEVGHDAVNDG